MFVEIEEYAHLNDVPIMSRDSIHFISRILNETDSRSLLEVGTAIAYSTLCFAKNVNGLKIDSIEKDVDRYSIAIENIKRNGYTEYINLYNTNALKLKNRKHYDAVILDAAKAQNEALFKLYFAFTDKVMIVDNVDYHGFTGHSQEIRSRNLRQMIKRIESFLVYLELRSDIIVTKHNIGDGILVIRRKR